MTNLVTPIRKEANSSSPENQKGIENHKKVATHFEAAAKSHRDAAKYHEDGNHEKACESSIKAQGHQCLANELQKEDAKYLALKN